MPDDPPGHESGQIVVLQDFRWVPVLVHRTPTAIQCTFEVVNGKPTVHAELLSEHDFSLYTRHHDYEALARSATGHSGGFEQIVETPGRYEVVIVNEPGAAPAAISYVVHAVVDPAPVRLTTSISPGRRLAVIAASLAVFFGTVTWSGRKLLRAWHNR